MSITLNDKFFLECSVMFEHAKTLPMILADRNHETLPGLMMSALILVRYFNSCPSSCSLGILTTVESTSLRHRSSYESCLLLVESW